MLKKVGKLVAVAAGLAALVWTVRDRFIQIATPREENLPRIRTDGGVAIAADDDLTTIDGIGPVFAKRLAQAGIVTFTDLASADATLVAAAAGTSPAKAESWIVQAKNHS